METKGRLFARAAPGLSDQLRSYYAKHLDPTDRPDPHDLGALQAIEAAQGRVRCPAN